MGRTSRVDHTLGSCSDKTTPSPSILVDYVEDERFEDDDESTVLELEPAAYVAMHAIAAMNGGGETTLEECTDAIASPRFPARVALERRYLATRRRPAPVLRRRQVERARRRRRSPRTRRARARSPGRSTSDHPELAPLARAS